MSNEVKLRFEIPVIVLRILLTTHFLGLIGWFWDCSEHIKMLQFGLGTTPAHLLMDVSALLTVFVFSTQLNNSWWKYILPLVGLALIIFIPSIGGIILLAIPIKFTWIQLQRNHHLWTSLLSLGISTVLIGIVVDWFWHQSHPEVNEENINVLLLVGHQIQLLGWFLGLIVVLMILSDQVQTYKRS
ncbi:MAG: hypothetical protein MET45_25405 [Nostoc sp. LLA-1]|nr:hypothetical protein [Cyanocohniella sp. LLY]